MADSNIIDQPAPAAAAPADASAVPFGYFSSGGNLYRLANPYPSAGSPYGSTEVHAEDLPYLLANEKTPWEKTGKIPAVRQGGEGAEGAVSGAAAVPAGGAPPTQTTDVTAPAAGAAASGAPSGGSMWGMSQAAAASLPGAGDTAPGGKWDPAAFGLSAAPVGPATPGAPTGAAQGAPTGAPTGAATGQWDPKAFGLGEPATPPPPQAPPLQPAQQPHTGMLANIGAGLLTGAGMVGDVLSDPVGTLIAKPATIVGVTAYDALMHALGKPGMPADLRKDLMGDATAAGPATGALFAGAEALGAPPISSIQPANNYERFARDVVTGGIAGIALGPQNIARNALTGASSVIGGDIAGEAAPEGYKEAAGLAGMVAGGAAPHAIEAGATRLPGATIYSEAARERAVARNLRGAVGNAPIETSPVGPTDLAQATNVAPVQGKVEYAKGIPEGSTLAADLGERVRNAVDNAIRFVGGGRTATRPESSAEFTRFYRAIEDVANDEASRLWNVPELANKEISPSAVQQAVANVEAQIPPEMHAAMSPAIRAQLGRLQRSGPTTVKDLNIIRSKLLKESRDNTDGMQRGMAGDLAAAFIDGFDNTPEIAGRPPQPTGTHTMVKDPVTGQITTTPDMSPGVPADPAIRDAYQTARDFTRRMKQMFADTRSAALLREARQQYTTDESAGAGKFFNLSYGTPEGPQSIADLAAYARTLVQQPTANALADGLIDTARAYFAAALSDASRLGEGKTFSPAALRDLMSKNIDWITRSGMFTPEQANMAMDLLDYARMLDRSRELTSQRTSQTNRLQEQRNTFVDRVMSPLVRHVLEAGATLGVGLAHGAPEGMMTGAAAAGFDYFVRRAETQMRELMARAVLDPEFAAQLMKRPTVQNASRLTPQAAGVVSRMARNAAQFRAQNPPGGPPAPGGPGAGGGGGIGRPGNRPTAPEAPAAGQPAAPGGSAGGPGAAGVPGGVAPGAATAPGGGAAPGVGSTPGPMFKRGAPLPSGPIGSNPAEEALTVKDILYGQTPAMTPRSRSVSDIAKELMGRGSTALKALGIRSGKIEGPDPHTDELLARSIASEVKAALLNSAKNAGDWYTKKVNEAMSIATLMHPEIATDPVAKMAYTAAMAITSQGETVPRNTRLADAAYETYKQTGRFPTDVKVKKPSVNENFQKLNDMLDEMGPENLEKFMHTEFTVRELEDMGYEIGGENKDTVVHGSTILGPKIGGGFFQNLNGNFNPVTMDLWYMRGWGRLTGTLVGQQDEKAFAKVRGRFKQALAADGRGVPQQIPALERRAEAITSAHETDYKKNREGYDNGTRQKSELTYAAERFLFARNGLNEAPTSGGERQWIRSVVNRARALLAQEGHPLTNADLQAIWWYPEKDLYAKLGGRDSEGINVDYSTALSDVAKSKGITDAQIAGAVGSASPGSRPTGAQNVAGGVQGGGQAGSAGAQAQGAAQGNVGTASKALTFGRPSSNTRNLSYELDFGAGAPFNETFPEWAGLSTEQKAAVSNDVLPKILDAAKEITGAREIARVSNLGGWHEYTNPAFKSRFFATRETAGDVADIIGYLGDQTKVFGYRAIPTGNKIGVSVYGKGMENPAIAQSLWDEVLAKHPDLAAGFSPSVEADGTHGIEILLDKGGAAVEKRVAAEMVPTLRKWAEDNGIDAHADTFKAQEESREHDWQKDPTGESYLSRLEERYGPEIRDRLQLLKRETIEPAIREAIDRHAGTQQPAPPPGGGAAPEALNLKRPGASAEDANPHPGAIQSAIDVANKITGGKAKIEVHDPESNVFSLKLGDKTEQVDGYAFGRLIRAAMDPPSAMNTLSHESLHVLKNMGVFTPEEWGKLQDAAVAGKWLDKYQIADRYPELALGGQLEEAIAHHFADYVAGSERNPKGLVGGAVQKVQRFFVQLKSALTGKGFRNADDIFADAAAGKIGNRAIGSGSAPRGPRTIAGSEAAVANWLGQNQGASP